MALFTVVVMNVHAVLHEWRHQRDTGLLVCASESGGLRYSSIYISGGGIAQHVVSSICMQALCFSRRYIFTVHMYDGSIYEQFEPLAR